MHIASIISLNFAISYIPDEASSHGQVHELALRLSFSYSEADVGEIKPDQMLVNSMGMVLASIPLNLLANWHRVLQMQHRLALAGAEEVTVGLQLGCFWLVLC